MSNNTEQTDGYHEIRYLQFERGGAINVIRAIVGVIMWPVIVPMALLARLSDIIFRTFSEFLSFLPYFPGVILRYEFYRFALKGCGKNVVVEFGTTFVYSNVEIGDNVLIGRYNIIHDCNIGSDVLIGERCTFLSGTRQHRFDRTDIPMTQQGGERKKIFIGDDCWIGSHSVVMENVDRGCLVGAASLVNRRIPEFSVAVGNPARIVRNRKDRN